MELTTKDLLIIVASNDFSQVYEYRKYFPELNYYFDDIHYESHVEVMSRGCELIKERAVEKLANIIDKKS